MASIYGTRDIGRIHLGLAHILSAEITPGIGYHCQLELEFMLDQQPEIISKDWRVEFKHWHNMRGTLKGGI